MLGNMLNDLAEAIRRWTEKNLWRKRLKTIQDGQEPDTPQALPIVDRNGNH